MINPKASRSAVVEKNINTWETVIQHRYTTGELDSIKHLLAPGYRYYGAGENLYRLGDCKSSGSMPMQDHRLANSLSHMNIRHDFFGEGDMLADRYFITGSHDRAYEGKAATGNSIHIFGIAIARFNKQGLLIEERHFWDEIEFLKQIEAIDRLDATDFLGSIPKGEAKALLKNTTGERPELPPLDSLLFDAAQALPAIRDPLVVRNEKQWREFLNKKFYIQDFATLFDVVSPKWHWHAPAGLEMNLAEPGATAAFIDDLVATKKQFPDITFHSKVFGEGNKMLYNVVCDFTHSAEMFGVPATGKKIRQTNLAVCYFDEQGRVEKEWEIYDMLSVYQQMGVLPRGVGSFYFSSCPD